MAEVEQTVVQISGHGRIHRRFGGAGPLKSARENAHGALGSIGKCFGGGDDPHSADCDCTICHPPRRIADDYDGIRERLAAIKEGW